MPQKSLQTPKNKTRRATLASGIGFGAWVMLGTSAFAAQDDLAAAVASHAGGVVVRAGKVKFEIAELVDNGNVVPMTVTVDSPMAAGDYVKSIAVFNEKIRNATSLNLPSAPAPVKPWSQRVFGWQPRKSW